MTPLPTLNTGLALRRSGFRSVPEAMDYAARGVTGASFYSARGDLTATVSWREARERAHVMARKFIGAGFKPGERILLTADTWPGFFDAFFGAQYAGLLAVPVSIPLGIGGKEAYLDQLRRQLDASGAVAAFGIDELAGFLGEAAQAFPAVRLHGGMEVLEALPEKSVDLRPLGPDDHCYIQFSSGSTRFPLGVDITQRALMTNLEGMTGFGLDVNERDRAVSWLPFYHDMGLIGFMLGPLCTQRSVDYLTPRDFARRPMQWLNIMSRNRGTIAYSPSFGYDLATRRGASQIPADLDLSSWRSAGIGGDMVRPDVLERFAETFGPAGFDPTAFVPSYGAWPRYAWPSPSARARLGVRTDIVDREALAGAERAVPATAPQDDRLSRAFVICGYTLPGHRLEVRGRDGKVLPDRAALAAFTSSTPQDPASCRAISTRAEATRAVLTEDGWLDTGDLGYSLAGEVVVTGRAKDLIIVNGRNVWPQDIEWAIEAQGLIKRGDSAAFSIESEAGERVIVAVLARVSEAERDTLARDVGGAVRAAVAVDCDVVLVAPTLGLPTTSSGKLSRSRTKANYLAGLYAPSKPAPPKPATA